MARTSKLRADLLDVLGDIMRGGRHSRTTVARTGVSLPTADRWLRQLLGVPGVLTRRVGKTTWFEWQPLAWALDDLKPTGIKKGERSAPSSRAKQRGAKRRT